MRVSTRLPALGNFLWKQSSGTDCIIRHVDVAIWVVVVSVCKWHLLQQRPYLNHEPCVHDVCRRCTCTPPHTAVPAAPLALHCQSRSVSAAPAAATMAAQCCASAAVRWCHPGSFARTVHHVQGTALLHLQARGDYSSARLSSDKDLQRCKRHSQGACSLRAGKGRLHQ
jgi:hypothetical protein